jgi:hypothetical protein
MSKDIINVNMMFLFATPRWTRAKLCSDARLPQRQKMENQGADRREQHETKES